jgi:hypothetical protein
MILDPPRSPTPSSAFPGDHRPGVRRARHRPRGPLLRPRSRDRRRPRADRADETARRAEACTKSDLPFRVDLLDWHAVDARFRAIVTPDRIAMAAPVPADR